MKKKNIVLPLILLTLCLGISYWVYLSYNKYSLPSEKVENEKVENIIIDTNNNDVEKIIEETNNKLENTIVDTNNNEVDDIIVDTNNKAEEIRKEINNELEETKAMENENSNENSEVLIYNIKDGEDFQSASVSLKRLMLKNNYDYDTYKNRVIFVIENGTKEMNWEEAKAIYFKKKQPSNGDYFLFQKFDIPISCTESQKKQTEKYIKYNWSPPNRSEEDTQFCIEWYDYLIKISREIAKLN